MKGSPLSPTAKRIVCLGDSLTLAIGSAELDKWPVKVALELEKEFPERYALFIRAWNGGTTFDVLQRMTAEAFYLMPATVLVTLGVNDAHVPSHRRNPQVGTVEFASNLREISRLVTEAGGNTIFVVEHVPVPSSSHIPGNGKTHAENYAPYRQAVLETAGELGCPVIDIPSLMADRGIETREIVVDDGCHLSRNGNAIYAKLILSQLRILLYEPDAITQL
ncbi:MAG: SGNH/GDSL hydrolase family protein [Terrimicrobiaceae bacterium]